MANGGCRLHGGLSTGLKTAEGIERIRRGLVMQRHGCDREPDAHQRKERPFPPQEKASYAESAQTFEARNDLAAKRPDPVI